MKFNHRYSIHFVIILILIGGVFLFLWREQAFDFLSEESGLNNSAIVLSMPPSAKDSLDTDIFENAKFIVLKNNFYKFDFNTICRDVSNQKAVGGLNQSSPSLSILCALGNNAPFVVPVTPENSSIPKNR